MVHKQSGICFEYDLSLNDLHFTMCCHVFMPYGHAMFIWSLVMETGSLNDHLIPY